MATTIGSLDLNAFSDLYSDSTQYFWFESNSSATYGAGAHVTLVPDTTFISNPTGQNILMNTDGFSIRNGLLPMMTLDNDSLDFNVVDTTAGTYVTTATFGLTGATIGQTGGAHIQISSSGLDVNLNSSTNIANFGTNGARIGQSENSSVSITSSSIEMCKAGAVCSRFVLPTTQKTCVYVTKARINLNIDEEVGSTVFLFRHVDLTGKTMVVDFVGPRQYHGEIGNTQKTYSADDKSTWFWYTTSTSESGTAITVKFNGVSTSGTYTFALRLYVDAISSPCYISCYPDMTDETVMFAVGNGTSDNARSNALTVDWNGNVNIASGAKYKINGTNLSASDVGAFSIPSMAGIIQMFAGSTPPAGWLVCDGTSYLRSDYPTLFEALGGTSSPWGLPDSTHFNVPDFRGRVGVGVGTGTAGHATNHDLGDVGGDEDAVVPYHNHSVSAVTNGISGGNHNHTYSKVATTTFKEEGDTTEHTSVSSISTVNTGGTGAHNHNLPAHNTNYEGTSGNTVGANMMPYIGINYIICTGKTY